MSDKRRLKSISSRYDLEVERHPDRWRALRARLSLLALVVSTIACVPWLLVDHRAFESQCVSDAHKVFEQKCSNCHDRGLAPIYRMVTFDNKIHSTSDKKCQACHRESNDDHLTAKISDDFDLAAHAADLLEGRSDGRYQSIKQKLMPKFSSLGCAGCHQEHRGAVELSQVADQVCIRCHRESTNEISHQRFELDFSGFSSDKMSGHKEFAIWRIQPHAGGAADKPLPESPLVESTSEGPIDKSRTKFSHHRHLDPELPARADSGNPQSKTTKLVCADCHQLETGGAYFRPISFEQHCHRCHQLGLKSTGELPHATPEIIRSALLPGLVAHLKDGQVPAQTDEIGGPTKRPIIPEPKNPEDLSAVQMIVSGRLREYELKLFGPPQTQDPYRRPSADALLITTCNKCHFTSRVPSPNDPLGDEWKVTLTAIPTQWMTNSRFRHDSHSAVDCTHCHTRDGHAGERVDVNSFFPVMDDALKGSSSIYASVSARDVLMPRIEICRQCHGRGSRSSTVNAVSDSCVECHAYHHTSTKMDATNGITDMLKANRMGVTPLKMDRPQKDAVP